MARSKKTGKRLKRRPSAPVTGVIDLPKYTAGQISKVSRLLERVRAIYAGLRFGSVSDLPHVCESIAIANQLVVRAGSILRESLDSEYDRIMAVAVFFARRIGQLYWSTLNANPDDIQTFLDLSVSLCNASVAMLEEGLDVDLPSLLVRADQLLTDNVNTTLIGAEWVEEPEDPSDYPSLVRPRLRRLIAKRGEWYVPIEVGGYGLVDAYEYPTEKDLSLFKLLR